MLVSVPYDFIGKCKEELDITVELIMVEIMKIQ